MASIDLNVGTSANANDGDTLRAAFIKVRKMFAEVYGQTYVSDTAAIASSTFKIKANKLQMTADAVAGDDGKVLTYDHASGSFTWETKFDGDITAIAAGAGLTGDASSGNASLAVGQGLGITVGADDISLATTVAGDGLTLTSGVLSVDAIGTDGISNDAVDGTKLGQFDDTLTAATAGHVLVSNGTDFIHSAMSGDATIASGGAITIANDAVDYDKLSTEFTTSTAFTAATDFDVDWSTAAMFTVASSIAMDLNFTNAEVGQVKTIIVTDSGGTSSLTFDSSMTITTLNGSYSATAGAVNYIQAVCTATDVFFLTISQAV